MAHQKRESKSALQRCKHKPQFDYHIYENQSSTHREKAKKRKEKKWQHWRSRAPAWMRERSLTHRSKRAGARGSVATRQIFLKYFVFTIAESSFLLILLFSIIFNLNYYFLFEVLLCVRLLRFVCFFLGQMRSNGHLHRQTHTHTHIDRQTNRTPPPSSNKSTQLQSRPETGRRPQTQQKVNKIYLFFIYLHDNFSSNSTEC